MKRMNYSSLTATIRRIHNATSQSKKTGIPVKEILDQDRELVRQLHNQRLENSERRKFLRSLGAIGAGVAMSGISHKSEAINLLNGSSGNDPRIAIIGAGAGGMRTAHRLQQYGILSKVYEARNRVGGRMYSKQPLHGGSAFFPGRVLETGGEFISSEHTALRNLVHQLNLQLEDQNKSVPGDEEVYLVNGMLYNENDLMDEWVGGLYETMKSALKDAPWQPLYNNQHTPEHIQFDTMTAREWLGIIGYDQGHWMHELLMTDLVSEYGLLEENSALNLIYLLGWNVRGGGGLPLAGTDERFTVVGGNDRVIHAMADELPEDTIETGRALTAIVGNSDGPYTLVFDTGPDEQCDLLVLTLPFNLIKDLDIDARILDGFSPEKKMAIDRIASSDNGKLLIEFADRHWDTVLNIHGSDVHSNGRAYSKPDGFISTWEGDPGSPSEMGILVDYTGGAASRSMRRWDALGVAQYEDVERTLGEWENIWPGISAKYTGDAANVRAWQCNWLDHRYSKGAFVSPATETMTVWWGAQWETEGNIYFAGEACDEEYWSYMNGAILSGERVAKEIHQR